MTRKLAMLLGAAMLLSGAGKPLLRQPKGREMDRVNPFDGQAAASQAGRKLYVRECAGCHGREAEGTRWGPALASPSVRQAPPGAIFWVLRNGSLRRGMPSFSHLPEARRWQIVTYLKTLSQSGVRTPNASGRPGIAGLAGENRRTAAR